MSIRNLAIVLTVIVVVSGVLGKVAGKSTKNMEQNMNELTEQAESKLNDMEAQLMGR